MEEIRTFRKMKGLTQEQLAESVGVKRSVISKYENGDISPSIDMIRRIADALGVEPWELIDSGVPPELKSYPIDSIDRQFKYITDEISALTEIDLPATGIDTHKIVIAVNKIMEVNNAILRTPRLSMFFDITEAVIGLKFVLCYLNFNWRKYEDDIFAKIIESNLFKDVLKNLLNLYDEQARAIPKPAPDAQEGTDTTPTTKGAETPPEGE